jgi:hypothetical protein
MEYERFLTTKAALSIAKREFEEAKIAYDNYRATAPKRGAGRPPIVKELPLPEPAKLGRPKKQIDQEPEPKRPVGRPRKPVDPNQEPAPKRPVGRPKRIQPE